MTIAGQASRVTAGIYCRMSLAIMGDTTKVDDQERMCRGTADRLGWEIGGNCGYPLPNGVYQDNNRSAWKHNRKRPAWDQMLADIEAGKINAIVVYHGDRLTRQPMDLEILIQLSRTRGIKLASPTGVRDLNNDDDQFTLGIEANVYRKESAATSRRRKQQYERWRAEGRTRNGGQGGRAFGFATDGIAQVPAEAAAIREMAGRILAGESAYAVARDLTGRGFRTPSGLDITSAVVIYVLRRPRTAGLMPDGEAKAAWEPVLDRETWERVRLVLEARSAGYHRTGSAVRHLLSGIALCGACGEPLLFRYSRRNVAREMEASAGYGCVKAGCRKIMRSAEHLEAYVSARVVSLLNDPRQPEGNLPVRSDDAPEWAALARERAETEQQVRDYSGSAGRVGLLMARLDQIDARMAGLRETETRSASGQLLARYRGITREQWEDLPLEVRRALVAASYRVTVLPASGRGPGFRTEDVRMEPAG